MFSIKEKILIERKYENSQNHLLNGKSKKKEEKHEVSPHVAFRFKEEETENQKNQKK